MRRIRFVSRPRAMAVEVHQGLFLSVLEKVLRTTWANLLEQQGKTPGS